MGRHAKGVEDTRAALVDAAWSLFRRSGFEATTVEAIVAQAGVSKGAFYHHFASKQEILDAVTLGLSTEFFRSIRSEVEDVRLPATVRLSRLLASMRSWRLANLDIMAELMRTLYRDENIRLRVRINRAMLEAAAPVLAGLIRDGVGEGVFAVSNPEMTARTLLHLSTASTEDLLARVAQGISGEELAETAVAQVEQNLQAFERLLGAKAGCLERPDRDTVRRLCGLFLPRGTREIGGEA
jgi:AcrR family transcriptional regulator